MFTHSFQLLASFILVSGLAAAQNPFSCSVNAGVPPNVRVEGVTEEVGRVLLTCTGGTPTAAGSPIPALTIDLTLNTNVTSRLMDPSGNRSEALLLLDEPLPAEQVEAPAVPFAGTVSGLGTGQYKGAGRPNVFGAQQMTPTSLRWSNIPFDPPGNGNTRTLRLVNVRANANSLGLGGLFSPSVITASVSVSGLAAPALVNPQMTTAFIVQGMNFSTTPATYEQCSSGSHTFPIVFTELIGPAFRHAAGVSSQNVPSLDYSTESMFYNNLFTGIGAGAGRASQGTLLIARFTNVPANVTISVPVSPFNAASGDAASLVATGTGGSTANASTGIVALTGGAGAAVWEITSSNPGAISSLTIPVTATFGASPQPSLGVASVSGDLAPATSIATASTDVVPRFVFNPHAAAAFTVTACSGAGIVSLSKDVAGFTANSDGSAISPPHDVTVSSTAAGVTSWTATSDSAWLHVTPPSGVNNGTFSAYIWPGSIPAPGTYTGKITVNATGASTGVLYLNCVLTVSSAGSGSGAPKVVKISGDGQLSALSNGFTLPLVVRVLDAAGNPISGKSVTWTEQGGANFYGPTNTTTDADGRAQMTAVPSGYFNPGTPFLVYTITATTDIGAATFTMTSYPVSGVGSYFPPPLVTLVKPAQENRTITAKLGTTTLDAVRSQVVSGGGNATNPTVIPSVALNVSTGNTNPATGIVARCEGGTPLSGADGVATCNLIVEGPIGTTALLVNIGALRDFPGVQLNVTAGDPVAPVILQGNGQSGQPGAVLPITLVARTADAYGNPLPATPVSWTVVPANAATLINPAAQSDANGNASAQVQLGATPGSVQIKVAAGGRESTFSLTVTGATSPLTLSLNRTALAFAGTVGGSVVTPPQDVFLTMTGGSSIWSAVSNSAWLGATPAAGSGSGRFNVFLVPSALPAPGTYTGKITVNASGATNGPVAVNCTLTVKSASTGPFGSFDTPANNSTGVSGSIAVTGWALDDIAVNKVTIWRDPIGPEPVHPNGYVYIGDAMFVPGTRPDVEARYPSNPRAYRAGWGYLLLTNTLPGAGNGTFKLHAIAVDEEGNPFELGSKTITVDNLHATKPFGAIDSPAPGQSISGAFLNQGWALTPPPAAIATNGATIWVNVDGVDIGHPSYGFSRSDISSIFPGYANSNTSAGSYYLISSLYSNTMHAISWNVYDNQGRGDGIGSRYFYIQNAGAAASAVPEPVAGQALDAEQSFQLRSARLRRPAAPAASYPAFRRGYDRDAALTPIRQAGEGLLEPLEVDELDKLEIHLAAGQPWTAALRVGDESRDLPIGSTFDAEGGIFYWQLGPGFLGEFTLEFRAADGTVLPVSVRVGAVARREIVLAR